MNVRFCPACRSLILAEFRYCPYCGAATPRGPELAEAMAGSFERLAGATAAAPAATADRSSQDAPGMAGLFSVAEASLDRLEAEMDLILEELAKEGRFPK
jgi:hypothetical protein